MPRHATAPDSPAAAGRAGTAAAAPVGRAGARLSPDERRRQLLGIGLRKFVERPVQELSLDEVAAEAGVSRGLLFHYFPSKTAYHRAVVDAAGRRVLRNVRPDEGVEGAAAVRQVVERFLDQVERRRAFYVALVYGQLPGSEPDETGHGAAADLRENLTRLVLDHGGIGAESHGVVHGWSAYVEDRALLWSARDSEQRRSTREAEVGHCLATLSALLAVPAPPP